MKKKVVFVITKATQGGAQRYVWDLATNLQRDRYTPLVLYGESGRLAEKLTQSGIEKHQIGSLARDIAIVSDVQSFFKIRSLLHAARPDIVHLNSSKAAGLGALAARLLRVPHIIFTVHGWPHKEDRNPVVRVFIYVLSWITAFFSHRVIVVSKDDELLGKKMWLVGKKIQYIPIGIEPVQLKSKEESLDTLGIVSFNMRVGTIAELTRNKGIAYGIRAIKNLKDRGVDATYTIVGTGEDRAELESLVETCGLSDRVYFTGYIENAAQYLRAFDMFLLPSVKEGMPYVLLEAASANIPIVMTQAANPEIAQRYQNIRVVPIRDSEAIAQAIIDTAAAQQESPLVEVESPFLLSKMLEQTSALYES